MCSLHWADCSQVHYWLGVALKRQAAAALVHKRITPFRPIEMQVLVLLIVLLEGSCCVADATAGNTVS